MKFSFDPNFNLIIVFVDVHGAGGMVRAKLALDTGATGTILSPRALAAAGIDTQTSTEPVTLVSVNGRVKAPLVPIVALRSLGKTRSGLSVVCHTLSSSSGIDGLLGLDFLRPFTLNVDFLAGTLELS